jgi:hypothetical protein
MNERIVVEHATEVQVANLAQSRTLKVTKPQGDQSIVLDLSDRNATFDLSAVADEKMTLVKAGPKLIILFDNQSTVTVDPFFDFSGKPLAHLDVELGAGRPVNGEQFAQLFSITEDQSVLRAAGIIPPSGADFHDASVDALPDGLRPLALLQHEGLAARISDSDDASSRHSIATVSPKPTITVPSPGGPTTTVFEAGLLASRGPGESAGTHAGQSSFPTTTKAGAINFNSPSTGGNTIAHQRREGRIPFPGRGRSCQIPRRSCRSRRDHQIGQGPCPPGGVTLAGERGHQQTQCNDSGCRPPAGRRRDGYRAAR